MDLDVDINMSGLESVRPTLAASVTKVLNVIWDIQNLSYRAQTRSTTIPKLKLWITWPMLEPEIWREGRRRIKQGDIDQLRKCNVLNVGKRDILQIIVHKERWGDIMVDSRCIYSLETRWHNNDIDSIPNSNVVATFSLPLWYRGGIISTVIFRMPASIRVKSPASNILRSRSLW